MKIKTENIIITKSFAFAVRIVNLYKLLAVNVGVAISKVNEEEANKVFGYLKEAGELDELYDTTCKCECQNMKYEL